MVLFPNAKINLGLHILSRREDNYHNLETLMHPVDLCDILEFLPSAEKETSLKLSGIPVSGMVNDNLVYKAYRLLKDVYQLPNIQIYLHKIIPSGAGLGGGSADAAFMLKGLNSFFELNLGIDKLEEYAASLGSDCSFFIKNTPAFAGGRGEILSPSVNLLINYRVLLFFPGFPVSTEEAYQGVKPDSTRGNLSGFLETGLTQWKNTVINDFEKTVFAKYPMLNKLKEELYRNGALYASMSGSGSSVYGIFEKGYKTPLHLKEHLIWEG